MNPQSKLLFLHLSIGFLAWLWCVASFSGRINPFREGVVLGLLNGFVGLSGVWMGLVCGSWGLRLLGIILMPIYYLLFETSCRLVLDCRGLAQQIPVNVQDVWTVTAIPMIAICSVFLFLGRRIMLWELFGLTTVAAIISATGKLIADGEIQWQLFITALTTILITFSSLFIAISSTTQSRLVWISMLLCILILTPFVARAVSLPDIFLIIFPLSELVQSFSIIVSIVIFRGK